MGGRDGRTFHALQQTLEPALGVNRAGSTVDHVLLSLPSFSVSEQGVRRAVDELAERHARP